MPVCWARESDKRGIRPHRIGLPQAARPQPHPCQPLLLILLRDFRRRPWHRPIFESFDPLGHPPFDLPRARSWQSPEPSAVAPRPTARFEHGYAVSHLLLFDTVSLTLPTRRLLGALSPEALAWVPPFFPDSFPHFTKHCLIGLRNLPKPRYWVSMLCAFEGKSAQE